MNLLSASARELKNFLVDAAQQEAIHHLDGPCEVIAGPGSGKTFVLVSRIVYLIRECKIAPSSILVLTFSKAAALHMKERYLTLSSHVSSPKDSHLIRNEEHVPIFGTFHSVFYQIVKTSSSQHYEIISSLKQFSLLETLALRYWGRKPTVDETQELLSLIGQCKSRGTFLPRNSKKALPQFREIFEDYNQYMKENGWIDFEDMIQYCKNLFLSEPAILKAWQERFLYLLVDEFQDINEEQFFVLSLLAGKRKNLFVVGDDDQSIYHFRGSDPSFMLDFPHYYSCVHRVNLFTNYRSQSDIVAASSAVIRENTKRIPKSCKAVRKGSKNVSILEYASQNDQNHFLCTCFQDMPPEERKSAAVIFRTHTQMKGLIRLLQKEAIPFQENGEKRNPSMEKENIIAGQELKIVQAYYRLAWEQTNGKILRETFFQVMNQPERFLLRRDFHKECYEEEELLNLFHEGSRENSVLRKLLRDSFVLSRLSPSLSFRYLIRVMECPVTDHKLQKTLEDMAQDCEDFYSFFRMLSKVDLLNLVQKTDNKTQSGVQLLTMHASKGLEFDSVFIPDLNEGILPSHMAKTQEEIEEERRLFYVAMTRAKNRLFLMFVRGSRENPRLPSRFLHALGVNDWID